MNNSEVENDRGPSGDEVGHNHSSQQQPNEPINADLMMDDSVNQEESGDFDYEHDEHDGEEHEGNSKDVLREQDRFLPIANIARIMKRVIPENGKVAKDAKETCQECVSEFISFITSEASERCQHEKRKTINGEDLLWAMQTLGFDSYVEPLKVFLAKYREANKGGDKNMATGGSQFDHNGKVDPSAYLVDTSGLDSAPTSNGSGAISVPVSAIIQQLSAGPQSILIQAGTSGTQQLMMTTAGGLQIPIMAASATSLKGSQQQQQLSPNSQQQQPPQTIFYFDASGNLQLAGGTSGGNIIMTTTTMPNQNSANGKSDDSSGANSSK